MPKRTRDYRETLLMDLQNPAEAASYLNAALADSDEMFLLALRDVAEAKQMAKVAGAAGIARESIYRMLAETGNPTYTNLLGILRAIGLRLAIEAEAKNPSPSSHMPEHVSVTEANALKQTPADDANTVNENFQFNAKSWLPKKGMSTAGDVGYGLSELSAQR